ncbi:MAG: prohibitin family protein, partial [Burkholderiaceae bacterium]|nr:prohibitin family protein [Burkholderiaceae bacterium]
GEAAANRALLQSLDPKLLEWERIKLQHEAIKKWNGVSPTVMGGGAGGGGGMIFNIPLQTNPAH